MPVQFLSDEWTEALEQRLNASEAFRNAAGASNVTIQNVINAPDGAKRYWMRFDGGSVELGSGDAESPEATIEQDYDTAVALARSELNPVTAFMTGNAIQANTVADSVRTAFGVPVWITGLVTATLVLLVIIGGITRIGRVTSVLSPMMAAIYVAGALFILAVNWQEVPGAIGLVLREAFNPTAGVAGTGMGVFLVTMMWGVRRGLFSNEAGQGSAPIAHAAISARRTTLRVANLIDVHLLT